MKKLKVATILGTRPEIIRLAECIKKCDICFNHILIHTGQNYDYELNEIFFNDLFDEHTQSSCQKTYCELLKT
jgi:UDP-N-acetylglucosamine 2-epimerase (non-hydrolysing)